MPFESALVARDAQTGQVRWTASLRALKLAPQAVVVGGGVVVATLGTPFGSANGAQGTPTVVAFDLATGARLWTQQQPWDVALASPTAVYALVANPTGATNATSTPSQEQRSGASP